MSKLEQLAKKIRDTRYGPHADDLREGQMTFAALADVDIELYRELIASDSDCFFDNNKIPAFYAAVIKHWGNE
jgi:hypothetical protein